VRNTALTVVRVLYKEVQKLSQKHHKPV
jgi:hypothetical protein